MRSCVMPRLYTHLVKELNVGTVDHTLPGNEIGLPASYLLADIGAEDINLIVF